MRADDQDKSAPMPLKMAQVTDKAFLGPEYLTWLYFHLEESGWEVHLPDAFPDKSTAPVGELVQFAMGKRAVLHPLDETGARVTLAGTDVDGGGELFSAIRRGALIDSLSLVLAIDSRVYEFTMSSKDGGYSGVKLPDLYSEPDEDNPLFDDEKKAKKPKKPKLPLDAIIDLRMSCLDELEEVLNALFHRFVTRRLARAWLAEDVKSMQKRVQAGLKERL
ncbi:MAG: hypothetical protein GY822_00375 [Deltaproteobacteria bacterium]|nr:hypothetical protein [Deltaproteobacteria bacterium]